MPEAFILTAETRDSHPCVDGFANSKILPLLHPAPLLSTPPQKRQGQRKYRAKKKDRPQKKNIQLLKKKKTKNA